MKNLFLTLFAVATGMAAVAQTDVWYWKDGAAVKVTAVDSLTFSAPSRPICGTENGYEWVDLGLPSGTKWATCNVGATKAQDYGDYYAWGEVTTKETYSWNNYKYGSKYNQLTKYCTDSDWGKDGFTDSKATLDPSDDAAYVNWGGKWRMPTTSQQEELGNQCYWVWTDNYNKSNVAGCIVYKAKSSSDKGKKIYKGKTPSSSYTLSDVHIFLPAAGGGWDYVAYVGEAGYYWSSSLTDYCGFYLYLSSSLMYSSVGGHRYIGHSVRAVIPGK